MLFRNAVIREIPDPLRWRVVPIGQGEHLDGWYAGPVVTVAVHWIRKRSFPCCRLLTDGAMKCVCETDPKSVRIIGYVPVIAKDRERFVVIVSAAVAKRFDNIKPGAPIRLARPNAKKRPLFVSLLPDEQLGAEQTKRIRPACIHDITPYLLHLWQSRELSDHFGQQFIEAVTPHEEEDDGNTKKKLTTKKRAVAYNATPEPAPVFSLNSVLAQIGRPPAA